eukprot:901355-Rhodomonas_salina.3
MCIRDRSNSEGGDTFRPTAFRLLPSKRTRVLKRKTTVAEYPGIICTREQLLRLVPLQHRPNAGVHVLIKYPCTAVIPRPSPAAPRHSYEYGPNTTQQCTVHVYAGTRVPQKFPTSVSTCAGFHTASAQPNRINVPG